MGISTSSTELRREVIREACQWFIEFRTDDITPGTRERFDEWLRHSPEHIQAYLEVAAAWAELPTQLAGGNSDIEALIARARASRDEDVVVPLGAPRAPTIESRQPDSPPGRRRFFPSHAIAAAVVAIAIGAGTLGWLNWHDTTTYTTEIGEQRTIRLPDDSLVDLNARSSIRVHFSKSDRMIDLLQGQAMFNVARDPQRPFIVRTDNTAVRAVGTQFDVNRENDRLVVTVVEGRVAVSPQSQQPESGTATVRLTPNTSPGDTQVLSAGEQLTVTPKAAVPKPHRADVDAATAWAQRRLAFDDTPLAEVAEQFNRYSVRRLVIDDPELARKPISGVYSSSDPDSLIGFLRTQPALEVLETDREIHVSRRSASGSSNP